MTLYHIFFCVCLFVLTDLIKAYPHFCKVKVLILSHSLTNKSQLISAFGHSYKERLREMGLFSSENRSLRGDVIRLYNYFKGSCSKVGIGLFSQTQVIR